MNRHPFSFTLGPGPYRFVGVFSIILPSEANQGRSNFHLAPKVDGGIGTCFHCGHAIIDCFLVKTGEGKIFGVGCDCIDKIGGEGDFSNISAFERAAKLLKRKKGQEQRKRRRLKLASKIYELMSHNEAKLKSAPHPSQYHSSKSLFDYCKFCFKDGKASLGALSLLEKKIVKILL